MPSHEGLTRGAPFRPRFPSSSHKHSVPGVALSGHRNKKRGKRKLSSFLPVFGGRVSSSHQAGTSICIPHQIQKASTRHLHPHQIQKTSMKHPHPHSMRSSRAVPRLAISDRFAGSDPCTTEMAAHSPPVRGPDDNCFCKSVGG